GRWIAKDPVLFAGGQANLYAYVGNDPINRQDPDGNQEADQKKNGGKGSKGGKGGKAGKGGKRGGGMCKIKVSIGPIQYLPDEGPPPPPRLPPLPPGRNVPDSTGYPTEFNVEVSTGPITILK